jgi:ribonuclease BN (tRNA processing enzyme)
VDVDFLPSCFGDPALQLATTLVVNNHLAVDAGCLGFADAETQAAVSDVVLTHAHMDHVATLPFYAVNRLQDGLGPARIHAPADVLEMVREGLFNDRLWPDLERLSTPEEPLIEFHELPIDAAVGIGGIELVAVPLTHVIPTFGYLLLEPGCSVVVATDTRDTDLIWERAAARDDLAGVFVEASFPESLAELADASGHLTPAGLARQLDKINRPVRAIAVHLKPSYREEILAEIAALGRETVEVGLPGTTYTF